MLTRSTVARYRDLNFETETLVIGDFIFRNHGVEFEHQYKAKPQVKCKTSSYVEGIRGALSETEVYNLGYLIVWH